MTAARKRSGLHVNDRRKLGGTREEWATIDREAEKAGVPWYEWLMRAGMRAAGRAVLDRVRTRTERVSAKSK